MKSFFSFDKRHTITEANVNFYAVPFVHPKRKMNEHDFIYMLEGEWKIGQNGTIYELKKDSLLILNANNFHYGIDFCSSGAKTMYFHVSNEENDGLIEDNAKFPCNDFIIDNFSTFSANDSVKKIFRDIVSLKSSGNQIKADIYFELLLCELSQRQNNISENGIEIKIQNIIHTSPERFFSNRELAEYVNVSVKTAENKFKSKFNLTIHQYMLKFKAEQAALYIKNFSEMSMKEIAYNLGFYDEYHFSRQFKKIMGISPTEYKNSLYKCNL